MNTNGRLLRLHCGPTDHVAVASLDVTVGAVTVRLDVLAAAHRVTVAVDGRGWEPIETVACSSGAAAVSRWALPNRHRWSTPTWQLLFDSGLATGPVAIDRARSAVAEATAGPHGLVTGIPGRPGAETALVVDSCRPGEIKWRAWHLYPGTDPHVVMTMTTARHNSPATPTPRPRSA